MRDDTERDGTEAIENAEREAREIQSYDELCRTMEAEYRHNAKLTAERLTGNHRLNHSTAYRKGMRSLGNRRWHFRHTSQLYTTVASSIVYATNILAEFLSWLARKTATVRKRSIRWNR
jgi:hypothetical protein